MVHCTMEYYSTVKKDEITKFAGKWMELETIFLNEATQTPRDEYYMFSLVC